MNRVNTVVSSSILVLAALGAVVPFIAILLAALQPPGSAVTGFSWPSDPQFSNFATAWSMGGFATLFQSSATVALVVVPVGVVTATLAGYAMGTMTFRGKALLLGLFLLGLTLPYETVVIALYYMLGPVGLLNTPLALILPLIGAFMPFGVFWMRAHFQALPTSLIEAAEIDGASSWTIFWRILLPTARPALSTLALLYFLWSWNQFLFALILIQNFDYRTVPAGLTSFVGQYRTEIPLLSAATVIVIVPVIVVYLIFQRQLIRGFLEGAIRG